MKVFRTGRGQGLVEYAFILALVAIIVIAVLSVFGTMTGDLFSDVNTELDSLTTVLRFVI